MRGLSHSRRVRQTYIASLTTVTALIAATIVLGQQAPPPRTMAVDEIRPGMRGYGLTVFRGTTPERFDVEVIDVLRNHRPQMDMVLIRPTHPILEHAGTVAGMSGSPIYLDDRLIGAYAYGWEFGRDPVAGVTPIANMLAELNRARRTPAGVLPGSQIPIPIEAFERARGGDRVGVGAQRRSTWADMRERARELRDPVDTRHGRLAALAAPFSVSGFGNAAMRYLSDALQPFGLEPLQTGSSGGARPSSVPTTATPARYVNGGSISLSIVSGDIHADSSGTITLVDGDHVLGYGHPFMGLGEVALTAATSRVAWILASQRRSTKIVEVVEPLGALVQDRQTAIVVDSRASAPRVPVHLRIIGNGSGRHNEWNLSIAYHRSLFPRLLTAAIGSVLEVAAGDNADAAWVVRSRVSTQGHGVLTFRDVGASPSGPGGMSLSALGQTETIERLTDNPFERVRVVSVDVDVEVRWARDFYFVHSIALAREEVDPGDTVNLLVTLAQYGGPRIVRAIPVTVPREVAGRDIEIEAGGGSEISLDLPEPESISDLVRNLTTTLPDDTVAVALRMPGAGVALRGRLVADLPSSALDALRPSVSTDGGEAVGNFRRQTVSVGRIVLGRDRVRLRVRPVRQ